MKSYRFILEVDGAMVDSRGDVFVDDDTAENGCWSLALWLRKQQPGKDGSVTCFDGEGSLVERFTLDQVNDHFEYLAEVSADPEPPLALKLYMALAPEGSEPKEVKGTVLGVYQITVWRSGLIAVNLGSRVASAEDALSPRHLVEGLRITEREAARILAALREISDGIAAGKFASASSRLRVEAKAEAMRLGW